MEKRPVVWPLEDYVGKDVSVELRYGREVSGTMTGFDQIGNLVLRNAKETKIPSEYVNTYDSTTPRQLGTVVIRSPHILSINACERQEFNL